MPLELGDFMSCDSMKKVVNPVLPGFYPDPSICRAGDYYYLVCSSFAYFPGLPVFRSSDGVKWEQIGNVIDRPGQLDFTGSGVSRGLFAPTIRYSNGKFYCICTLVDKIGNFFVTADDPKGPWSDPIVITDAPGIDPSLFFDDDGTAWYVGTRPAPEGVKYNGNWEIWIQKLDIATGKLLGESKGIWRGALKDCIWPEGPHIYKINGKYYLIHAEGGTGPEHAVMVARSEKIEGPWEGKKANPILTHRHLGKGAGIVYVGHADLVQFKDGSWWMCCLGSRPYGENGKRFSNMGRETFMVPVKWEDEWPVVSWQTGLVEHAFTLDGKVADVTEAEEEALRNRKFDDFEEENLPPYWLSLRSREKDAVSLSEEKGCLRLHGKNPLSCDRNVNVMLMRQTAFSYSAKCRVKFSLEKSGDAGGLVCFQNEKFNYRLQASFTGKSSVYELQLVRAAGDEESIVKSEKVNLGREDFVILSVTQDMQKLKFEYGFTEDKMKTLASDLDASILSYEKAGGFVGSVLGMFCVAGKEMSNCHADFDWFKYEDKPGKWICPVD
jgi:alpha-N-arabinofuranosidase